MPRFGIDQGEKPDGTKKVRAVDHFSWSRGQKNKKRKKSEIKSDSVNGHYVPDVGMKHDHLDDLVASMKLHYALTSQVWSLRTCPFLSMLLLSDRTQRS